MGAKTSQAMLEARKMIENGATAYQAAKAVGLTQSAITKSQWWKDRRDANLKPDERLDRAHVLIMAKGHTAYQAAKLTGLSQSTISRADWYRTHVGDKNA